MGLSRHPEKIGSHPKYEPRSIDIDHASVTEIADAFGGLDVLINGYGPHSTGPNAMLYSMPPCLIVGSEPWLTGIPSNSAVPGSNPEDHPGMQDG